MEDTFVSLPNYEGFKSYLKLRFGDFNENYLLCIRCFCLGKHLKTIEFRLKKNFKRNENIKESFQMLDEIVGRTDKIIKYGTLLDFFTQIDYMKYEDQIFEIFSTQAYIKKLKFNKKFKYRKEYQIYKKYKARTLDEEDLSTTDRLGKILCNAFIYNIGMMATNELFENAGLLINHLKENKLEYLLHELDSTLDYIKELNLRKHNLQE